MGWVQNARKQRFPSPHTPCTKKKEEEEYPVSHDGFSQSRNNNSNTQSLASHQSKHFHTWFQSLLSSSIMISIAAKYRRLVRKRLLRQFESWTEEVYAEIETRCLASAVHVNVREIIAEEEPVYYLDLAVKSSMSWNWRNHAMDQIQRHLPQECREYLVAETEVPDFSLLGQLRSVAIEVYLDRSKEATENFKIEMYQWFENSFFEKIGAVEDMYRKSREIRRYLDLYTDHNTAHFTAVYAQLVRLCTDPPLDCELTVQLLQTLCVDDGLKKLAFELVPDSSALEIILCHAKQTGFDFWGLWCREGTLSKYFNPVVDYMSSDTKHSCARVLLKYGFRYSSELPVHGKQFLLLLNRRYLGMTLGSLNGLCLLLSRRNHVRMMVVVETFIAFADFEENGDITDRVTTLVHLTRTLTEPYVTPTELFQSFKAVISPLFSNDLLEICDRYITYDVYEEDYGLYQPRPLFHLCRCKIRGLMAGKLPEGISELNVSKKVAEYLRLEC